MGPGCVCVFARACMCVHGLACLVLGPVMARTTKYEPLRADSEAAPVLKQQHRICGCCGKWVELSGGVRMWGSRGVYARSWGKRREVL